MKQLKLLIGSGLGSGYLPFAPGTWGSLLALFPVYFLIRDGFPYAIPVFCALCGILTYLISETCEQEWGEDPGKLVMDEWAGQSLAFISISFTGDFLNNLMILGAGFILFRFFDILKPLGIKSLQNKHGWLGILADDLLAGLYALICLKSLIFWVVE